MSILNFVPPGWTLEPHQKKLLLEYERVPDYVKIVMILAPVAAGKTLLAYIIAAYEASRRPLSSTILTRDNSLVGQYRDSLGKHIRLAPYRGASSDRDWEQSRHSYTDSPVRVANFFSHLALRDYPSALLVDEFHQTAGVLQDMESVKLWRRLCHVPEGLYTFAQILMWLEKEAAQASPRKEIVAALKLIKKQPDNITFEWGAGTYRNVEDEYLRVFPLTPKHNRPVFWPPRKVERIVGLSATTSIDDLMDVGLDKLPTRWLECDSPIPVERRLCIYEPFGDMSFYKYKDNIGRMALGIDTLAARHSTTRGLIHTTYGLAGPLAGALRRLPCGARIFTHNKFNKMAVFKEWQASPNGIFIACGMAEGIDLAYDKARWQIISKIVWPNKMDRAVSAKMDERANWYGWETLKLVMQQYGRVCRRPDDEGVTYICDSNFEHLMKNSGHLASSWFKLALR